jgi:hypothetical protein
MAQQQHQVLVFKFVQTTLEDLHFSAWSRVGVHTPRICARVLDPSLPHWTEVIPPSQSVAGFIPSICLNSLNFVLHSALVSTSVLDQRISMLSQQAIQVQTMRHSSNSPPIQSCYKDVSSQN